MTLMTSMLTTIQVEEERRRGSGHEGDAAILSVTMEDILSPESVSLLRGVHLIDHFNWHV